MSNRMAVVILGHGSRLAQGQLAVSETAQRYAKLHQDLDVGYAFMEFASPTLADCIEEMIKVEKNQLFLIIPLFLALGNHVTRHMPEEIARLSKKYPHCQFKLARPLGSDPLLCDIIESRVGELLEDLGNGTN